MYLRKQETFHQRHPQLEVLPKTTTNPKKETLFDTMALLLQAEQAVENVAKRNPLLNVFKPLKNQPIDPVENYFRRLANYQQGEWHIDPLQNDQEKESLLTPDMKHVIDEMLEMKKETVFPIELTREDGFGEGYAESMELQMANFVRLIEQQGLLASRSFLEQVLFQRVFNQLFSVAEQHIAKLAAGETHTLYPNIVYMVTSPPDKKEAGYHGINSLRNWNAKERHHSFHFVYIIDKIVTEKDEQGNLCVKSVSVKAVQFRTWHNINELLALHQRLATPIDVAKRFPITNQIIANTTAFSFPENDSQEDILNFFRKELYEGETNWARNTEQIPRFSKQGKQKLRLELGILTQGEYLELVELKKSFIGNKSAAYLNQQHLEQFPDLAFLIEYPSFEVLKQKSFFHKLYLQPMLELFRNISDEQINDPAFRKRLSKQVHLREEVFTKAVKLRIEELNINPTYTEFVKNDKVLSLFKNPFDISNIIKQVRAITSEEEGVPLNNSQRLQDQVRAHRILEDDQVFHKKIADHDRKWLAENAVSLFSLGGLGGAMQCYTIGALQLPSKIFDPGSGESITSAVVKALAGSDLETKQRSLQQIELEKYVELDLPGANRIWMVPASYLENAGCRVGENGVVLGPCSSKKYPEGIPLDAPEEKTNEIGGPFAMNRFQFAEFVRGIKESILQDQLEDQLDFEHLSETDKRKAQTLITELTRKLFKVSLSNLIAGVDDYQEDAYKLPQEKLQKITSVEALEKLVIELESSENETDHEELEALTTALKIKHSTITSDQITHSALNQI
jgi:hypothetical protein